jgi:hypothetical protein
MSGFPSMLGRGTRFAGHAPLAESLPMPTRRTAASRFPLWCAKYARGVAFSSVVCASGLWHGSRTGPGRAEEGSGRGKRVGRVDASRIVRKLE